MDSPIRAVLFPVSEPARYSTHHALNAKRVRLVRRVDLVPHGSRLESHASSDESDEEDNDANEQEEEAEAVVLQQPVDRHCFTFGSDLNNFFVLKHDPDAPEEDDVCYFNLHHCQFYPDPDFSDVWLENTSTSTFIVKSRALGLVSRIGHGESTVIQAGWWEISLGVGLQFICGILSTQAPASLTNAKISLALTQRLVQPPSREIEVKHTAKSDRSPDPVDQKTAKVPPPSHPQDVKKTKGQGSFDLDERRMLKVTRLPVPLPQNVETTKGQQKPAGQSIDTKQLPESYTEKRLQLVTGDFQEAPDTSNTIGKTRYSKVEKRFKNGRYVAVKISRRPDIPIATKLWQREVSMLESLGRHVRFAIADLLCNPFHLVWS